MPRTLCGVAAVEITAQFSEPRLQGRFPITPLLVDPVLQRSYPCLVFLLGVLRSGLGAIELRVEALAQPRNLRLEFRLAISARVYLLGLQLLELRPGICRRLRPLIVFEG